jgi:molecular chaperone DnaK
MPIEIKHQKNQKVHNKKDKDLKIAVFDLGGGTFDVSIIESGSGVIEVKSTNGDTFLGGEDYDQKIVEFCIEEFKKSNPGIDLSKDSLALQRLKETAEKTKIELSSRLEVEINLPYITADATGPKHLNIKLSRAKFEQLTDDLTKRTLEPCKKALQDSGFKKEEIDEVLLVGGMTRMPKIMEIVKEFFGKEPSKGVNPDEAVAAGAAIQAGILGGNESVKDLLLLDVAPLSLGIETMGGVMTKIIERNTTIPTEKSQVFSTAEDNQSAVTIRVYQGERSMARDNKLLGEFNLEGIAPAPRGMPQIEVSFKVDSDGIMHISAKDKGTGKVQQITIKSSGGLSDADIERMVKEAEANAEKDKQQKELIETRNEADHVIHSAEKQLKEHGDKVSADKKNDVETEITKLKEVKEKDSLEDIKSAIESLREKLMKIGEEIYSKQGANGDAAAASGADEGSSESSEPKDVN